MPPRSSRYEMGLLLSLVVLLVLSGIRPHDRFTWVLEVFPVLIGVPILVWIYPRFRFTRLVYTLLWLHAIILMVGGHTDRKQYNCHRYRLPKGEIFLNPVSHLRLNKSTINPTINTPAPISHQVFFVDSDFSSFNCLSFSIILPSALARAVVNCLSSLLSVT